MEVFLTELAELLEVEPSEMGDNYLLNDNNNWDSLALVSVILMIDEYFQFSLSNESLRKVTTVGELLNIINEKKAKLEV